MNRMKHLLGLALGALITSLIGGCATTNAPTTRIDYDKTADFSVYRTYGFPKETGTDRGGYATLVTSYFKSSVSTAMEARGYKYSAENPDLLVNFYMNTRERTEIRPGFDTGYGYYGYRSGLYSPWYDDRTITYQVGTINVDLGRRLGRQRFGGSAGEPEGDDQRRRHRNDASVSGQAEHVSQRPLSSASICSAVSSISTVSSSAGWCGTFAAIGSGSMAQMSSTSTVADESNFWDARMGRPPLLNTGACCQSPESRCATQFTAAA